MACVSLGRLGVLSYTPKFKPGDPPPSGYTDWQAWAEVQHRAGLRQKQCGDCGKWKYQQEMSGVVREIKSYKTKRDAQRGTNPIMLKSHVCLRCANMQK